MALLPVELSDDLFAFQIGKLEVGELLKTSVSDFSQVHHGLTVLFTNERVQPFS